LVQTEKLASLGQLTAGLAHEIKNPLNFVNNFSVLSADLIEEMNEDRYIGFRVSVPTGSSGFSRRHHRAGRGIVLLAGMDAARCKAKCIALCHHFISFARCGSN
jgi:signal transduction histidine kinase